MSLFSLENLLKSMGIDPREIAEMAAALQREMLGMREGFGAAMVHFDNRITVLDAKLDRVLAALNARASLSHPEPINGHHASDVSRQPHRVE